MLVMVTFEKCIVNGFLDGAIYFLGGNTFGSTGAIVLIISGLVG